MKAKQKNKIERTEYVEKKNHMKLKLEKNKNESESENGPKQRKKEMARNGEMTGKKTRSPDETGSNN